MFLSVFASVCLWPMYSLVRGLSFISVLREPNRLSSARNDFAYVFVSVACLRCFRLKGPPARSLVLGACLQSARF